VNIVENLNFKDSKLRRIPTSSNTELPHIAFPVILKLKDASIASLYDTGGALNNGNLALHRHILATLPSVLAEFVEFNGDNPFKPIKLCSALINPAEYDGAKYRILSAVIRYHAP